MMVYVRLTLMTEVIRKLFDIMPFLFGIGFIAPLTAQLMIYWGVGGGIWPYSYCHRVAAWRRLGPLR